METVRIITRVILGVGTIVGIGYAGLRYQSKSGEQIYQSLPEDMRTQMKQKKYLADKYEAEQARLKAENRKDN